MWRFNDSKDDSIRNTKGKPFFFYPLNIQLNYFQITILSHFILICLYERHYLGFVDHFDTLAKKVRRLTEAKFLLILAS